MRVGRLLAPAVGLAALTLTVSGCSIPAWVPLIGEDKPLPAGKPSAAAEASPPAVLAAATLLAAGHERLPDAADVLDRVICVVNNDAITLYELQEAEAHYLHENKERAPDGEARKALRERLLSHIIESRIQLQQAEREKVTVEDAEVSEQLEEIMKKLNAKTQPEFEEMLKGQGLTLEAVKKRIKDQISFEARHILFLPEAGKGEEGWEAARQRGVHVYALILEGQDFAELAKKYSEDASGKDGGSLGSLKRGELAPDIEAAVLKLDAGQVSPTFRSQVGYHLFRLDSKESLAGEALVQARNQIRDILYRQKYDARLQEWLAEMKQRAIIDIRM